MNTQLFRCPACENSESALEFNIASERANRQLVCTRCRKEYRFRKQASPLVEFVTKDEIRAIYPDLERQTRLGARFYDMLEIEFAEILGIERDEIRREYLSALELQEGSVILDVGIGTGSELEFLAREYPDLAKTWTIYGVDLSIEMLRISSRKLVAAGIPHVLSVGIVEHLPFKDHSFDVVFHTGAINEFRDQRAALLEMLRVAKPGSLVTVTDEWMTDENARQPIGQELIRTFPSITVPSPTPFDVLPSVARQHQIKTLWKGYGYSLLLRKETHPLTLTAESELRWRTGGSAERAPAAFQFQPL